MGRLPEEAVRAYLAEPGEIPAAMSLAQAAGLTPAWDAQALVLRVPIFVPPASAGGTTPIALERSTEEMRLEPYLIEGVFDDYRVLPPVWRFLDPRTAADIGPPAYPLGRVNSVLHGQGLICAHWSRMAYAENGGPHRNWSGMTSWQQPVEGTIAMTVSDMLGRLIWEVRFNSQGRMAALPPFSAAA